MNQPVQSEGEKRRAHPVEIRVNRKPVVVSQHEVTGLQIKEAAIAQGVKIQLSFQLSEELGHHQTRIVGDAETVHVHEGSRFLAVHGDDNS
jgi:hypothetical protein